MGHFSCCSGRCRRAGGGFGRVPPRRRPTMSGNVGSSRMLDLVDDGHLKDAGAAREGVRQRAWVAWRPGDLICSPSPSSFGGGGVPICGYVWRCLRAMRDGVRRMGGGALGGGGQGWSGRPRASAAPPPHPSLPCSRPWLRSVGRRVVARSAAWEVEWPRLPLPLPPGPSRCKEAGSGGALQPNLVVAMCRMRIHNFGGVAMPGCTT
jgi:hypothetical protein